MVSRLMLRSVAEESLGHVVVGGGEIDEESFFGVFYHVKLLHEVVEATNYY